MTESTYPTVTGIILAGGEARRMGGNDKGLIPYVNQPLIAHVIHHLAPQVEQLLINANRNSVINNLAILSSAIRFPAIKGHWLACWQECKWQPPIIF